MIRRLFFLCLFLSLAGLGMAQGSPVDQSSQLVVVTTAGWNSVSGQLQRFEKQGSNFQAVGKPIPIVVGVKGLGWGEGVHPSQPNGPQKKEGDGKAPAGIFDLGKAMGYSPQALSGSLWPYASSTDTLYCVDDKDSTYYNQITSLSSVGGAPKWKSAEKMRRKDDLYKWLVVVDHNTPKPQAGAGSCVFLHVWRSAGKGTAGCTAMSEENILEILKWLNPGKHPLLVQLPEKEYKQFKSSWGLP